MLSYEKRKPIALDLLKQLQPQFEAYEVAKWAEPEILQPADLFISLSGEDIRRRMVLTEAQEGSRLALRPEFTVPICNDIVQTAENEDALMAMAPQIIAYHGEAWRLREDRDYGAFQQAGIEWLFTESENETDAKALCYTIEAQEKLKLKGLQLVINDLRLINSLIESLSLPDALKEQIASIYSSGNDVRKFVSTLLAQNAHEAKATSVTMEPEAVQALLNEVFSTLGFQQVGGRDVKDIAERFMQKATASTIDEKGLEQLQHLDAFLALHLPCKDAVEVLDFIAENIGGAFTKALADFKGKLDYFVGQDISMKQLIFNGEMVAKQAYYTGLIFSLRAKKKPKTVFISGGRYDALFEKLGAPKRINAVGCALWLDDIASLLEDKS